MLRSDVVFKTEGSERPVLRKVVGGYHLSCLRQALRGQGMAAEIPHQSGNCDLSEFVDRSIGVNYIFPVEPGPSLKELHRPVSRIACRYSKAKTFPVSLELLILAVTFLQQREWNLGQRGEFLQIEILELRLDLDPFDCVIVVDMLNLVAYNEGKFIFAGQLIEQPLADENMTARQRESIYEVGVGNEMKAVGQLAFGMPGDKSANPADINCKRPFFRSQGGFRCLILLRHLVPDSYFLVVGEASDVHGRAGEIALKIGCRVEDRIGADRVMPRLSLRKVKAAQSNEQDRRECKDSLHNSRRIDEWNRV